MPGVEQYWQQVEATRAVAAGLDGLPADQQVARLAAEAERFRQIKAVVLPSNVAVATDHTALIAELTADPPDAVARHRAAGCRPGRKSKLAGASPRPDFSGAAGADTEAI